MNQLLEYQRQQIEEFEKLPVIIAQAVAEEMKNILTPIINKMDNLVENLINNVMENQQKNLDSLVNSFVENMKQSLGDKFSMLEKTIEKTCELQNNTNEMMEKIINDVAEEYIRITEINERIERSLENIIEYEGQIQKFNDSIIENNNENRNILNQIIDAQEKTHKAVEDFAVNITNTSSYINIIKDIFAEQKDIVKSENI